MPGRKSKSSTKKRKNSGGNAHGTNGGPVSDPNAGPGHLGNGGVAANGAVSGPHADMEQRGGFAGGNSNGNSNGNMLAVPEIIDVVVSLPDAKTVEIRSLATDTIQDLRNSLCDHIAFCHETAFSFHHERYEKYIRNTASKQLQRQQQQAAAAVDLAASEPADICVPEHQEIDFLKPYHLVVHTAEYTYDTAVANVRRLIDIVACTTVMGVSHGNDKYYNDETQNRVKNSKDGAMKLEDVGTPAGNAGGAAMGRDEEGGRAVSEEGLVAGLAEVDEESEFGLWKAPRLGDFYKFFSMRRVLEKMESLRGPPGEAAEDEDSHEPPLCSVRWLEKEMDGSRLDAGDFFCVEVQMHYRSCDPSDGSDPSESDGSSDTDGEDNDPVRLRVVANRDGFYVENQPATLKHSLVQLLRCESSSFREGYALILECFANRNAWGNIPVGIRNNTWLVPPGVLAEDQGDGAIVDMVPLPVEDRAWQGDDGGHLEKFTGDDGCNHGRNWRGEFAHIARMDGSDAHSRIFRDRRCFLLHQLYTDAASSHGMKDIAEAMARDWSSGSDDSSGQAADGAGDATRMTRLVDSMTIDVKPHGNVADVDSSSKTAEGHQSVPEQGSETTQSEFELLRGLTSDENTAAENVETLSSVVIHHCGFVATIEAADGGEQVSSLIDVASEPYAESSGANSLNISSLRTLLPNISPKSVTPDTDATPDKVEQKARDRFARARDLFENVLDSSMASMSGVANSRERERVMRWELGANWALHILSPAQPTEDMVHGPAMKSSSEQNHADVDSSSMHNDLVARLSDTQQKRLLSISAAQLENFEVERQQQREALIQQLQQQQQQISSYHYHYKRQLQMMQKRHEEEKQKERPLHTLSLKELMNGAYDYHNNVALPQLVTDFGSLELSPVDGKTLTEFLHSRGINMSSLGDIAKQADGLLHVKMLCVQEMVMRSLKRLFRCLMSEALTSSVAEGHDEQMRLLQEVLAFALNVAFARRNTNGEGGEDANLNDKLWSWMSEYILVKFGYTLNADDADDNVRQFRRLIRPLSLLRNLCNKLGINLRTRDYDFNLPNLTEVGPGAVAADAGVSTFTRGDVVCMVPVVKHCNYTSSDARALLESSKMALDRGLLDSALTDAIVAVDTMKAVCGASNRNTAVAMALMAVVMYHTGDFAQAAVYQQRAMQINEREYGLDHPDTIKSYGDLAVFYYRLQHTELALTYVHRALYLLHMSCGPSHPNTAATLINLAMMMEGLGGGCVNGALRYLHEALNTNTALLGPNHVQTAASYHAIAIALSLLEPPAYALSVQHENTTLNILEAELGPDDIRTVDANAWLEYFETKLGEIEHAKQHNMKKMPENNIASKGHLHVDDLLKFINDQQSEQHVHVVAKLASESRNLDRSNASSPTTGSPARVDSEATEAANNTEAHRNAPATEGSREESGTDDEKTNNDDGDDHEEEEEDDVEVILFSRLTSTRTRGRLLGGSSEMEVSTDSPGEVNGDEPPAEDIAATENDLHQAPLNDAAGDDEGWQAITGKSRKDKKSKQQAQAQAPKQKQTKKQPGKRPKRLSMAEQRPGGAAAVNGLSPSRMVNGTPRGAVSNSVGSHTTKMMTTRQSAVHTVDEPSLFIPDLDFPPPMPANGRRTSEDAPVVIASGDQVPEESFADSPNGDAAVEWTSESEYAGGRVQEEDSHMAAMMSLDASAPEFTPSARVSPEPSESSDSSPSRARNLNAAAAEFVPFQRPMQVLHPDAMDALWMGYPQHFYDPSYKRGKKGHSFRNKANSHHNSNGSGKREPRNAAGHGGVFHHQQQQQQYRYGHNQFAYQYSGLMGFGIDAQGNDIGMIMGHQSGDGHMLPPHNGDGLERAAGGGAKKKKNKKKKSKAQKQAAAEAEAAAAAEEVSTAAGVEESAHAGGVTVEEVPAL